MNRMTPEEARQALYDCSQGKEMQRLDINNENNGWFDCHHEWYGMDFERYVYRVKPAPREFYIRKTTGLGGETWSVTEYHDSWNDTIKVREVIE